MASPFDDLATKIPKGEMGSRDPSFVTDFLGRQAPLSFSGQPALPSAGSPTPSAGPSGPSGTGAVGEKGATGLLATPGGATPDLSGGGGGEGVGEGGGGGGADTGARGVPSLDLTMGGRGVNIGLSGNISPRTGNPAIDSILGLAIGQGLGRAGFPTSASGLLSLTGVPALSLIGGIFGAFGIPLTVATLGSMLASLSPTSIQSIEAALNNPDPNALNLTAEQALTYAAGIAGPTYGGPQAPSPTRGYTNFDVNNPPPEIAAQLGRTDIGVTGPTAEGPGISGAPPGGAIGAGAPGAGLGEGGPGGPGPGAPSDSGATGGGTDAGEA